MQSIEPLRGTFFVMILAPRVRCATLGFAMQPLRGKYRGSFAEVLNCNLKSAIRNLQSPKESLVTIPVVLDLARDFLITAMMIAMPALVVSLVIGVIIGILQTI